MPQRSRPRDPAAGEPRAVRVPAGVTGLPAVPGRAARAAELPVGAVMTQPPAPATAATGPPAGTAAVAADGRGGECRAGEAGPAGRSRWWRRIGTHRPRIGPAGGRGGWLLWPQTVAEEFVAHVMGSSR
ncbi:hypothetical protein MSHI_34610 [Mycobacterium shinjukuense]|uniref:Uncharacterized protein n=1 Tax=Mycobacterium shinjukuense TaxID=398694 RepID=A0A7I7MTR6_9MYCO|nr:hypothetical protein MSHI_34610 [Mycobacterium shinjukuense]